MNLYQCIRVNTNMGVSKNRGTPKWMVYFMENPIKMDDLGVKPPIFGNTNITNQFLPTARLGPIQQDVDLDPCAKNFYKSMIQLSMPWGLHHVGLTMRGPFWCFHITNLNVLYIYHILHYIYSTPQKVITYTNHIHTLILHILHIHIPYTSQKLIDSFSTMTCNFLTIWGLGSPITTRHAPFVLAESPVGWLVSLVVRMNAIQADHDPLQFFQARKNCIPEKVASYQQFTSHPLNVWGFGGYVGSHKFCMPSIPARVSQLTGLPGCQQKGKTVTGRIAINEVI